MALTLSGDDGVAGVNGSATTPAIQGTDTNTGLTFGTDTVNVVTGGSTRTTVDSSGRVFIGTTTEIDSGTGDDVHVSSTVGANVLLGRNDTAVIDGNNLGQVRAFSFHGSSWNESARIQFSADGAHAGSGDVPGRISFQVCTDGAAGVGEQMQLDNAGNFKCNSGYGSVATAYGVRAWASWRGDVTSSGNSQLNGSGNVSSVTDNGTGDYTINFTNAMPDQQYVVVGNCIEDTSGSRGDHLFTMFRQGRATGSVRVNSINNAFNPVDADFVFAAVIR